MIRLTFVTLLIAVIAGCKFTVLVPRGGEVQSVASGTCLELTNCVHDITDSTYSESFTAVPATGFQFLRWNAGDDFLCKDSTNPVCVIDNTLLAGIIPDQFIERYKDLYIMPIFAPIELPGIVLADGKEWAMPVIYPNPGQASVPSIPDLIDAVCPISGGGVCSGTLNGFVLDGWTWASIDDVTSLFNTFLPGSPLGPAPDEYSEGTIDTVWGDALFAAGFSATESLSYVNIFFALTRTPTGNPGQVRAAFWEDHLAVIPVPFVDVATTQRDNVSQTDGGPIFYRTP